MTSTIFTEEEFWPAFTRDIQHARGRVLIQSPFLTTRRVSMLSKYFRELTSKGVVICLFVQEPRNWTDNMDTLEPEVALSLHQLNSAIETLRSMGIHVNLRKRIHAKLAVIDEKVMWEGSLNPLSHADTKEHMRRWQSEEEIRAIIEKYALASCSQCLANRRKYGMGAARDVSRLVVMGGLLKGYRQGLPLAQKAFAKRCRLRQARLSEIEAGRNITLNTFFDITTALRVEPVLIPEFLVPAVTRLLHHAIGDSPQFEGQIARKRCPPRDQNPQTDQSRK